MMIIDDRRPRVRHLEKNRRPRGDSSRICILTDGTRERGIGLRILGVLMARDGEVEGVVISWKGV
jgi:hypothetical protein